MNTFRMNMILPVLDKLRQAFEVRFAAYFKPQPSRRPRFEVQLEFPWQLKR
jgi:hypothetical protein